MHLTKISLPLTPNPPTILPTNHRIKRTTTSQKKIAIAVVEFILPFAMAHSKSMTFNTKSEPTNVYFTTQLILILLTPPSSAQNYLIFSNNILQLPNLPNLPVIQQLLLNLLQIRPQNKLPWPNHLHKHPTQMHLQSLRN